jgi:Domain of unknown function (DUF4350)
MSRTAGNFVVVVTGLLVVWAVWAALQTRFERGDVYPAYSSLRSDPVGCKVLHDALVELDGVAVERSLEPLDRLVGGPGTTLFVLGVESSSLRMSSESDGRLIALARSGTRVVVTLSARSAFWWMDDSEADESDDDQEDAETDEATRREDGETESARTAREEPGLRGLEIKKRDLPLDEDEHRTAVPVAADASMGDAVPPLLDWRSPYVFEVEEGSWRAIYTRDNEPVLIERSFGMGTVVLVSDTYPLSNEGLFTDRQTGVASWLIGGASRVVFDESHLGVRHPVGVAVLIRRYRLTGFFVGLALLTLFYVWRTVSPFVPAASAAIDTTASRARTSQAALVHVLRRGLAGDAILAACTSAWKRSFSAKVDPSVIEKIDALEERSTEVSEGYRAIFNLLSSKRSSVEERGSSTHE